MKAMILAAGYGTRLQPLTEEKPKALVEVNGIPLLEIVIKKLVAAGVTEMIINTHHFSEQIVAFLQSKKFGLRIELSHETEILGTGGGLKQASHFFTDDQSFFLHNVDILSTIDLKQMYQHHVQQEALVTLALQRRKSNRYFIVDDQNYICGHDDQDNKRTRLKRAPTGNSHLLAFCGIHVISPQIFKFIESSGRFSIVDVYLKLIEQGLPIIGYPADQFYWKDIGQLKTLEEGQQELNAGIITIKNLTRA